MLMVDFRWFFPPDAHTTVGNSIARKKGKRKIHQNHIAFVPNGCCVRVWMHACVRKDYGKYYVSIKYMGMINYCHFRAMFGAARLSPSWNEQNLVIFNAVCNVYGCNHHTPTNRSRMLRVSGMLIFSERVTAVSRWQLTWAFCIWFLFCSFTFPLSMSYLSNDCIMQRKWNKMRSLFNFSVWVYR